MMDFVTQFWSLIIIVLAIVISAAAQIYVTSNFNKYSRIQNRNNLTGFDAANKIAQKNGLDYSIEGIAGNMTDHYDPRNAVVRLSETVGPMNSIAAVSVAAHEVGHAIQHQHGYSFISIRSKLVPVVNVASSISPILIMLGIFFGSFYFLAPIGVALFSLVVLFQLVTLPVEFDASKRALANIHELGLLTPEEEVGAKRVLRAAALTYVAGLLVSLLQLLRLVLIVFGGRRRN